MESLQLETLKIAFLEFLNKLYPALPEELISVISDFKEQLNQKSPSDLYLFAQNMPSLKKSDSTSVNSSPEPQLSKVATCGYNPVLLCTQKDSDEKSQSGSSVERYHQMKIEINKNFFLKPSTKFTEHRTNKCEKNVDIEAKVARENINKIDTLQLMPQPLKSKFVEKTGLLTQIKDALNQFKKDCSTIITVYEKSTEITTPQTPNDQKPNQQQYFYFQQMPQPQICQFKDYSIYCKRGVMQPVQFDMQFQLLQQQYQNQFIYRKLYF